MGDITVLDFPKARPPRMKFIPYPWFYLQRWRGKQIVVWSPKRRAFVLEEHCGGKHDESFLARPDQLTVQETWLGRHVVCGHWSVVKSDHPRKWLESAFHSMRLPIYIYPPTYRDRYVLPKWKAEEIQQHADLGCPIIWE